MGCNRLDSFPIIAIIDNYCYYFNYYCYYWEPQNCNLDWYLMCKPVQGLTAIRHRQALPNHPAQLQQHNHQRRQHRSSECSQANPFAWPDGTGLPDRQLVSQLQHVSRPKHGLEDPVQREPVNNMQ